MSNDIETPSSSDYVQSLSRGLSVITAFSAESATMTLTEVAERTGLTRATARRFLLTLETLGYVRNSGKDFSLTPKVMELGFSYLSSLGLPGIISPRLAELSAGLHESASSAVLEGNEIVYIARSAGRKIMQVQITVGTRFPAYATSMGRVLLAGMPEKEALAVIEGSSPRSLTPSTKTSLKELAAEVELVRSLGYSFVDQELEPGLRSLAVPIHGTNGAVAAAINVSTTSSTPAQHALETLLPTLRDCAEAIEEDLKLAGI